MACKSLNNIYTNEQNQQHNNNNNNNNNYNYTTPRISFSNGFAEANNKSNNTTKQHHSNDQATVVASSTAFDFAFSVPTYDTNSADELFFNGRLLPVVEDQRNLGVELDRKKVVGPNTLRDELLVDDDDDNDEGGFRIRLPTLQKKSSFGLGCKWKDRFGSFRY